MIASNDFVDLKVIYDKIISTLFLILFIPLIFSGQSYSFSNFFPVKVSWLIAQHFSVKILKIPTGI